MLTYSPASPEQYNDFLQMMREDGQVYWENTMRIMQKALIPQPVS